uniref:Uncharacterized protein n=1 Tax=Acrobeloides nanus TaxID=290746 RepID=A0A914D1I9_9BILA
MWLTLAGGLFLAAIDVTLEFLLTNIQPQLGCAAIGCFVSFNYKIWSEKRRIFSISSLDYANDDKKKINDDNE